MITNEQIRQTINDCTKAGHAIGMRDISYILLCRHYEDHTTAYRILFGLDADFNADYANTYDQTLAINYLRDYIEFNLNDDVGAKKKKRISTDADITFEENKSEIIKLIQETKDKEARGELDAKESLNLQTKLRVALNDKFGAKEEEAREQIVVVNQKYDAICGRCGCEVARRPISKEEAMEMYDLVEKE